MIGAWYGVEVVGVAAHVNAGANGAATGWGATTVSPFILLWNEQKVGNVRIDQRVVWTSIFRRGNIKTGFSNVT